MSITRDRGFIMVECDKCHTTLEMETKDFTEALGKMREANWKIRNVRTEFKHFCNDECLREYLNDKKGN